MIIATGVSEHKRRRKKKKKRRRDERWSEGAEKLILKHKWSHIEPILFFFFSFFLLGNTLQTTAYLRFCFWQILTYYNLCSLYGTYMRKVDTIMIAIFIDGNTDAEIISNWMKYTLVFLFPLQVISNHVWSPSEGFILLKDPMLTPVNTHCNSL